MNLATLTPREREQVDAANSGDGPAVVLLHDLWLLAQSWDPWRARLADAGLSAVAVEWPREPASVDAALAAPQATAGVGLEEARGRALAVVGELREPPLVIGHCFGALLAQQIAGKGLARATVAIAPAPMKGAVPAPDKVLVAVAPVLGDPGNRERAVRFTYPEFRYAMANAVTIDEAHALWESGHVAGSGRAVFEVAAGRHVARQATSVDTVNPNRGPLLVISAARDRLIVPEMSASTFRIQSRNPSPTDFVEFFDRGHTITVDSGWPEVADRIIEWFALHREG